MLKQEVQIAKPVVEMCLHEFISPVNHHLCKDSNDNEPYGILDLSKDLPVSRRTNILSIGDAPFSSSIRTHSTSEPIADVRSILTFLLPWTKIESRDTYALFHILRLPVEGCDMSK